MVEQARSWLKDNQTLVLFLLAQGGALAIAGASMLSYFTRLDTRVTIMEERGAAYTVARMDEMKLKINSLEAQIKTNQATIDRLVQAFLKDRDARP